MNIDTDEDFPEHPKTMRFCALLQNPVGWAYLWKLWRFCKRYQHDGDLSGYHPGEIETQVGWTSMDGRFFSAAVEAGFIDRDERGTRVHNWMRRMGAALIRMEIDRLRKASARAVKGGDREEAARLDSVIAAHRARLGAAGARASDGRPEDVDGTAPDVRRMSSGQAGNGAGQTVTVQRTSGVSALLCSALLCPTLPCADLPVRAPDPGGTERGAPPPAQTTSTGAAETAASKLSGYEIQLRFGQRRAAALGGAPWATPSDPKGKATSFAERLTAETAADIDPALVLFFAHVKAGDPDWDDPRYRTNIAFCFGSFISRWPDLLAELHGTGPPPAPKPKARPGEVRYDEI